MGLGGLVCQFQDSLVYEIQKKCGMMVKVIMVVPNPVFCSQLALHAGICRNKSIFCFYYLMPKSFYNVKMRRIHSTFVTLEILNKTGMIL